MRIGYSLAVAVLLSAPHTLPQAAEGRLALPTAEKSRIRCRQSFGAKRR